MMANSRYLGSHSSLWCRHTRKSIHSQTMPKSCTCSAFSSWKHTNLSSLDASAWHRLTCIHLNKAPTSNFQVKLHTDLTVVSNRLVHCDYVCIRIQHIRIDGLRRLCQFGSLDVTHQERKIQIWFLSLVCNHESIKKLNRLASEWKYLVFYWEMISSWVALWRHVSKSIRVRVFWSNRSVCYQVINQS